MTGEVNTVDARHETRERADLCGQYRPIGIGAVAAALLAGDHRPSDDRRIAANCNSTTRPGDSIAA